MSERVTLRNVADRLGLHYSTVSLALRGDSRIAQETRDKVRTVADELGYKPDAMLSALSSFRHGAARGFLGTVGYLTTEPLAQVTSRRDGHAAAYLAARQECERVGMKLDAINVNEAGVGSTRVASLLEARGIRGLLLAPLPLPRPFLELPWERYCSVALGYSITAPALHRACLHQTRTMQGLLRALRELGYRRIGLMMEHRADLRTDHNFLGSYLAEAAPRAPEERVGVLLREEMDLETTKAWVAAERPDCVIGCVPEHLALLRKAGVKVPKEVGFCLVGVSEATSGHAGMNERWDDLGRMAVGMLLSLLRSNDHGLPEHPRFTLVEGRWSWAATVRAPAVRKERKKKAPRVAALED
jgi:DNA-binding LacI/PurR family transcriptional regulator